MDTEDILIIIVLAGLGFLFMCVASINGSVENEIKTPEYIAGYNDYPDATLYNQIKIQTNDGKPIYITYKMKLYCKGFEAARDKAFDAEIDSRAK